MNTVTPYPNSKNPENYGLVEELVKLPNDKTRSITEIAVAGLPKPEDLDTDGYCWWGWAANHTAANPMFWQSTWTYAKPPGLVVEKATHWAPAWAFPVIK